MKAIWRCRIHEHGIKGQAFAREGGKGGIGPKEKKSPKKVEKIAKFLEKGLTRFRAWFPRKKRISFTEEHTFLTRAEGGCLVPEREQKNISASAWKTGPPRAHPPPTPRKANSALVLMRKGGTAENLLRKGGWDVRQGEHERRQASRCREKGGRPSCSQGELSPASG